MLRLLPLRRTFVATLLAVLLMTVAFAYAIGLSSIPAAPSGSAVAPAIPVRTEASNLARSTGGPSAIPPTREAIGLGADPGARTDAGDVATVPPTVGSSSASPVVGPAFDGLHFGTNAGISNLWYPPDVQVAVGPDHVVEMVNLLVGIYTKQGTAVDTQELSTFFGVPSSDYISDPKIQYDVSTGRWFATITDVTTNRVGLAVSTDSDPTAAWTRTAISGSGCLDQPILGVGADTVIVSANVFSSCTVRNPNYLGARYWVLNKADLVAGRTPALASFGPFSSRVSVHPVQVLGSSAAHFMVTVDWSSGSSANSIILYNVTGVPPGPVTLTPTNLSIRTVRVPPSAEQAGTRHTLDTSDIRVSDAVWFADRVWLGLDAACIPSGDTTTHACIRIVEIDTAKAAVAEDFDIAVAGKDVFYPALRTDGGGNLVVAFGFSSASEFPGVMVTGRLAGDPPNAYQPPVLVREGSGPEDPGACTSTCRYGDYFGAGVDPTDATLVWGAAEFGTASGWGTHIFGARVKAMLTFSYAIQGGGTGYSLPALRYVTDGQTRTVALGTTPSTYVADAGSLWSATTTLASTGHTEERWQANGTEDAVVAGLANASTERTWTFFHQFRLTFNFTILVGPSGGTSAPHISLLRFGSPIAAAIGLPVWADAGGAYAIDGLLRESTSSERWMLMDYPASGTVTAAGDVSLLYVHQYSVTFAYSVLGGGSGYAGPTVSYHAFEVLVSTTANATVWADATLGYSYSGVLPGSTLEERWSAEPNREGATTAPGRVEVVYRHQYYVDVATHPAGVGSVSQQAGWYDAGSSLTVSASAPADWKFQGWTGTGTGSYTGADIRIALTVDGPVTETAEFYPGITIRATGGGSVSYAYDTTAGTVPSGSSITLYVPPGTEITITATPGSHLDAFGGWSGTVSGGSNIVSVRVDYPMTATANFGPSFAYVIAPTALILGGVALLAWLVWRRRKKQWPPPH